MSDSAPKLEFGLILGDAPTSVDPRVQLDGILRQVEVAQRWGLTHVCIGQHFLYPGYRWLQPIPLLARLAGETGPDVRLVTSMMITPFYNPVVLAEELATLDIVCGGRLIAGFGAGYRPEEFDLLDVPHGERYARLEEAVELIRAAWQPDTFDFNGRFWRLQAATPHVTPLQRPGPPIWIGALRPPGVRRAARIGDSWMAGPGLSFAEIEEFQRVFEQERLRVGLPPARLPIRREIVFGPDLDAALALYEARTRERYLAYAARGRQLGDDVATQFRSWALERAILGTPDECIASLRRIDAARFGPVIVRASWPEMANDEVCGYLEQLGREVVSAFV